MRVHPSFDFNAHGSLMADFGWALNPDEGAQQWHAPVYSCSVSVYPFCPPRGASSLHLIMCPLAVPRLWVNQLEIMFSFSTAQKSSEERLVHEGQASSHNRISQRICRDFTSRKWKEEPKTEEDWKEKSKIIQRESELRLKERSLVLQIFCQESELIRGCTEFQFNSQ